MSAYDAITPQQFYGREPDAKGRLPVKEFIERFPPGEDETWERAARRIRGTERYQALVDHPERMRHPVSVHADWVANGHHRVVRAMETGQAVPYEHWQEEY